ncbi:MAG: DUF4245 family protein [Mycobacteriales bacterium]
MSTVAGRQRAERTTGRTFVGLLRALVPSLLVVLFLVWWQRGDSQPVPTVDPGPEIAYAKRISPTPLPAPGPLPAGWRATSSRVDAPAGEGRSPVTLSIGYLTAADRFAQLVISDRPVGRVIQDAAPGATEEGTGPDGFDRYRTGRGEPALVARRAAVTILVTGDAAVEDLVRLAAAVH